MQKRLRHITIGLLIFSWLQTNGQTLLLDSLKAKSEKNEHSFIIIPAYYEQLSQKFNLAELKQTDSFSIRLWTGSMFGYSLTVFTNKNAKWDSHSYSYSSDTAITEIKLTPKITTLEFLDKLRTFDFDTFVSQFQIKNFTDTVDDGTWYTLEITTGKTYKVFQYHSPELYNDIDNKKFSEVIKLCSEYFFKKG